MGCFASRSYRWTKRMNAWQNVRRNGVDMAGPNNNSEQKILEWLGGQHGAMLALLETLVNTDSGSYDKPGVDAVGGHIREFLQAHGIASEVTADSKFGDAISATVGQSAPP